MGRSPRRRNRSSISEEPANYVEENIIIPMDSSISRLSTTDSSTGPESLRHHTLVISSSGHERFQFQFSSPEVLSPHVKPTGGIFSFVHGVSRLDLLACLPSITHCIELKAIYSNVFSPVRHFNRILAYTAGNYEAIELNQ